MPTATHPALPNGAAATLQPSSVAGGWSASRRRNLAAPRCRSIAGRRFLVPGGGWRTPSDRWWSTSTDRRSRRVACRRQARTVGLPCGRWTWCCRRSHGRGRPWAVLQAAVVGRVRRWSTPVAASGEGRYQPNQVDKESPCAAPNTHALTTVCCAREGMLTYRARRIARRAFRPRRLPAALAARADSTAATTASSGRSSFTKALGHAVKLARTPRVAKSSKDGALSTAAP